MSLDRQRAERQQLEHRIERLVRRAREAADDELQAELAKYLCILISGLIEARCRECASGFARRRSASEVFRFVEARLNAFRSPSCGKIRDLFRGFDPERAVRWHETLPDDQRDAIDSINNNRNQLAHGRQVGLSLGRLMSYRDRAVRAMAALDREFR